MRSSELLDWASINFDFEMTIRKVNYLIPWEVLESLHYFYLVKRFRVFFQHQPTEQINIFGFIYFFYLSPSLCSCSLPIFMSKVDESMTSSNHTKYQEITLICYTDAGYLSKLRNVMSQTGFIFLYSRNVISWISTKHTIIVTFPIYTLK